MGTSRRDFLKVSALGLAANVAGATQLSKSGFPPQSHHSANPSAMSVWVTNDQSRYASAEAISWKRNATATRSNAKHAITLHPQTKFQPILGFGAAFTDAACYTLNQLSPGSREQLMHELFSPSEMGFDVCRTCIGASDYSTKVYGYDEGDPDPELTRFSIDHDREYILPTLRAARAINPDLFLFSTPWSPPGWMKDNNSMLGGVMRRKYMPSYANYFVKFLQAYEAEGVPIQAVSVQNEVDTEQDGRMPACAWPQEYEADFVRKYLGPSFEAQGLKTKIWIIDHNYNLWGRALAELETPDVRKYTNAIAWHGYVGKPEWIDRVHDQYPEVEMYWTEGGPDYTDPHYLDNWSLWSATFTGTLRHWCRSITAWNFALDEVGKPNLGPFPCGGLVSVNSQSKEITRCGQYWAFAHYSKSIRRGAVRFDTQSAATEVQHVGFENPDGQRVLVLTNQGAATNVALHLEESTAEISLDSNSVTTLVWR
jgi:glucosylceramidase